jgi:hypothetical protein
MVVMSHTRGHPIRWDEDAQEWVYKDTGVPIQCRAWKARAAGTAWDTLE